MVITALADELHHTECNFGESSMKMAIPLLILVFSILSVGVLTYRAAAKPRINVAQAERCIGFNCWPIDLPIRHRPNHRQTLRPVW
jgi:hypothetical protein